MSKIYIARHGQTEANAKHLIISRTDIPLNKVGLAQAQGLVEELSPVKLDAVFSSNLKRAYKTAQLVAQAQNIPHIVDERIFERDYGILEHQSYNNPDIIETITKFYDSNDELPIENAEPLGVVIKRINAFLDEITKKYRGKNILIISHAGVMGFFKHYFEPIEDGNLFVWVKNCEVWEFKNNRAE